MVVNEGVPIFDSIVWAVLGNYFKELEDDRKDLSRLLLDDAQKQAQGHSIQLHSTFAEGKPVSKYPPAEQRKR